MSSRIERLAFALFLGSSMWLGCTEPTPNYCQKAADCTNGRICDVARAVCVVPDTAVTAPVDGSIVTDGPQGTPAIADAAFEGPGGAESGAGGAGGTAVDAWYASETVVLSVDAPVSADTAEAEVGVVLDSAAIDVASIDDAGPDIVLGPDVIIVDGPGTCGLNSDCPDPTKAFCVGNVCTGCQAAGAAACGVLACDAVSGACVECTADSQCSKDPAKGFCVANACTGCASTGATGCAARIDGNTTCATSGAAAGRCVECAGDTNCKDPAKSFCVANACDGCQTASATACTARSAAKPVCSTSGLTAGTCVECSADVDCKDPTKSFCVANACVGCQAAPATACSARAATKPVCSASGTAAGTCVECIGDTDCSDPSKSFCVANACTGCQTAPATACSTRLATKPVCATGGTSIGTCVECAADSDCKTAAKSFCVANACAGCQTAAAMACSTRSATKPVCSTVGTLAGQCVTCMADADCTVSTAPICNTTGNACIPCTADSQCVAKLGADPGVCMAHQDGRCATDAETLYVAANVAGCVSSGTTGGTKAQPFCGLQPAVTLMGTNASKRLVVLRSISDVVSVANSTQVSVVGQGTAGIRTGVSDPGITLSGTGNLYARDLSVVGDSGYGTGITTAAGTTLRLERVKVVDNVGGGILLNGAAFDFNDVLVSGNGSAIDGPTIWSGIYVKSLPNAGAATKLNLVSVVNNSSPGIYCTAAVPTVTGSNLTVYASTNGGSSGVNVHPTCNITLCTAPLAGTCGSSLSP